MGISKFHKCTFALAFVVYLITAINSKGYLHYDEHYQIIEFANLKLGLTNAGDIAWEYNAQIRPALQPAIAIAVFKTLNAVGITDAYILALALRLLTLLLALTAIYFFVKSCLPFITIQIQKWYILVSYFLWFLPFLNVRFSSETWSGLLFLFAVAVIQLNVFNRKLLFTVAGLLLGLSFLCRFQAAFLIIGVLAWLIIIIKTSIKNIAVIIIAAGLAVVLGFGIDGWFYNELVFTPWNYFKVNIVQNVAAQFGTLPWHAYFSTILNTPTWPIGILILVCFCIVIYKMSTHFLLWVILPFVIAHSLIAHKEDRFLIPLINFVPLLIILGWQQIKDWYQKKIIYRTAGYIFIAVLLLINLLGLAVMGVSALGYGTKAITSYIHNNYKGKPVNIIYTNYTNPYNVLYWLNLKESFYSDDNVTAMSLQEFLSKTDSNLYKGSGMLLTCRKINFNDPAILKIIQQFNLQLKMQSMPEWIAWITQYYANDKNTIMLYGN
jgi:GPI mannosyltransferase 3